MHAIHDAAARFGRSTGSRECWGEGDEGGMTLASCRQKKLDADNTDARPRM